MFDRWIKRKRWTRSSKTLFWSCKYSEPKLEINAYTLQPNSWDMRLVLNFKFDWLLWESGWPNESIAFNLLFWNWEQVACPVNNTVPAIFALKLWKSGYKCFLLEWIEEIHLCYANKWICWLSGRDPRTAIRPSSTSDHFGLKLQWLVLPFLYRVENRKKN